MKIHVSKDAHSKNNFECDKCEKTFSKNSNMKQHIESVHDEKKDFCAICAIGLSTRQKMKAHYERCKEKQLIAETLELAVTLNSNENFQENKMKSFRRKFENKLKVYKNGKK